MSEPLAFEPGSRRAGVAVAVSLISVYLIWGSTYLAMRMALDSWPPFMMGGIRFLSAGVILLVVLRARGTPWPTLRQWVYAGVVGVLLLAMGNGFVALAESGEVDSGVAATVVATMPMWMALIGSILGERPSRLEWAGLFLGFVGVAILHSGGSLHLGNRSTLAILAAPIAWALGSVLSRRLPRANGLMSTSAQMMVGGAAMMLISLFRGETVLHTPSLRASLALVYLVVFGSLLAFSAYGFLLRTTRTVVASSYAYVNPVVALILGAVLGNEGLTLGKLAACAVIVMGVVLATRRAAPKPAPEKERDGVQRPARA